MEKEGSSRALVDLVLLLADVCNIYRQTAAVARREVRVRQMGRTLDTGVDLMLVSACGSCCSRADEGTERESIISGRVCPCAAGLPDCGQGL